MIMEKVDALEAQKFRSHKLLSFIILKIFFFLNFLFRNEQLY